MGFRRMEKILITGTAGFIGFHLANRLISEGFEITGLDNINDYYDPELKFNRLKQAGIRKADQWNMGIRSEKSENYTFYRAELNDKDFIRHLFREENFDAVIHLAAQAGVRYSLTHPDAYIESNLSGFLSVLEACRAYPVKHLVYASSSSVYGLNEKMPFSVKDNVDHPVSLYAASKKANELMAHTYSHLFNIPVTGLRFFTVYGPWGRPDMALFIFTEKILKNEPIDVFNFGEMERDFTYIDDIVEGVVRVLMVPPEGNPDWKGEHPDPASSPAPYRLFNIGNNRPVKLMDFIHTIEKALGKKSKLNLLPIQPGDVAKTWADVSDLTEVTGYKPETDIEAGINAFVRWYVSL
ncbi:MAG: NAD-dependent epimerase [Chlorobi bacterium]|nr:NAD-dependent epimerase [Chlorobiota bacterium]